MLLEWPRRVEYLGCQIDEFRCGVQVLEDDLPSSLQCADIDVARGDIGPERDHDVALRLPRVVAHRECANRICIRRCPRDIPLCSFSNEQTNHVRSKKIIFEAKKEHHFEKAISLSEYDDNNSHFYRNDQIGAKNVSK